MILIRSEEPIEVAIIGLKVTEAFGGCWELDLRICANGISVHGQARVTIEGTTISDNEYHGIEMWDSSYTTIKDTTIKGSTWDGIRSGVPPRLLSRTPLLAITSGMASQCGT